MYQTSLDALIYPAEINTISLGNFLDGHAQVKPGIDPLGLLVRQRRTLHQRLQKNQYHATPLFFQNTFSSALQQVILYSRVSPF